MAFYVLFALLALCTGQTVSPTTSPSPSPTPCSAPPGYFCSGGSALICPIGAYCAGGSALNVSCYPVTACTFTGLSAQPPCYWNVSTLAGSGFSGFSDGLGTTASFSSPVGIHYSRNATFVADSNSNRIRKMAGLLVSTSTGSGSASFLDAAGVSAAFNYPTDVRVDYALQYLYISDCNNNRIRRLSLSTLVVSTFAGSTIGYVNGVGASAKFYNPQGVTISSSGVVYVGDRANHRVRQISPGGSVALVAGSGAQAWLDGIGAAASFKYPQGLYFDELSGYLVRR